MNYLYRKVQKDMEAHAKQAKHSPEIFESEYLRIDPNESRGKLASAVKTMGDYFMGKEIAEGIIIVTEPRGLQETPAGACAPSGNNSEIDKYNYEHMRLHAERKATVRFCANFLSCIWCKFYRGVADPEHVWKLLSYLQFVLGDMEASAIIDEVINHQQEFIEVLKGRVEAILNKLDEARPGVVEGGWILLRENGMHPEWSFALPYALTSKGSKG
jgi:hypothetical protein